LAIKDELSDKVGEFASNLWDEIPNAYVLPTVNDLTFLNSGEHLNVTVFYADISGSTAMVEELSETHAAEYYKAFLHCASQLIKRNNGEIQAYDGDRVMAIYLGDHQADDAVRTALELNYAVTEIINPAFERIYSNKHRKLKFTVGIDSGRVLAIKVGVRAVGELAWIGGAANYAAKMNSFEGLDHDFPIRVTSLTHAKLTNNCLYGTDGSSMWEGEYHNLNARSHYRTRFYRVLS
jgi:class 3 adenylate cyclase